MRHVNEIVSVVLSLRKDLGLTKVRPNCKPNALLVMTVISSYIMICFLMFLH